MLRTRAHFVCFAPASWTQRPVRPCTSESRKLRVLVVCGEFQGRSLPFRGAARILTVRNVSRPATPCSGILWQRRSRFCEQFDLPWRKAALMGKGDAHDRSNRSISSLNRDGNGCERVHRPRARLNRARVVFLQITGLDRHASLERETRHSFSGRRPCYRVPDLFGDVCSGQQSQSALLANMHRSRNAVVPGEESR